MALPPSLLDTNRFGIHDLPNEPYIGGDYFDKLDKRAEKRKQ